MGLKNEAVVWRGRLAKCVDVQQGEAVIAWIDHRDQFVVRHVPAAACLKFADATRVRSFWPDSNLSLDREEPASKARKNRKRVARGL